MEKKGGIRLKHETIMDMNEAFIFFIKNSKNNKFIGHGKSGITFLFTLNDDVESPYISMRSNSLGSPVNELIVKICFITDPQKFSFPIRIGRSNTNPIKIETNLTNNFISECEIQSDVFEKSNQDNESICPSVAIYKILSDSEFLDLFSNIDEKYYQGFQEFLSEKIRQQIKKKFSKETEVKIGIIAMEFLSDTSSIEELSNSVNLNILNKYLAMAFYELYRLFKIGYFHGDFNLSNIFVCKKYKYFNKYEGRVFLIDFGASFPANQIDDVEISPADFVNILNENISPIYASTTGIIDNIHSAHNWIQRFKDPAFQNIFKIFEIQRQIVIDEYHKELDTCSVFESDQEHPVGKGGSKNPKNQRVFDFSKLLKLIEPANTNIQSEELRRISQKENANNQTMLINIRKMKTR